MDYTDEDEYEAPVEAARKFHFVFVFAHLFALFANITMAWRVFFAGMADMLGEHNLHLTSRDKFESEAGAEIERLVKGEVDG
jgi:hypothetical protein